MLPIQHSPYNLRPRKEIDYSLTKRRKRVHKEPRLFPAIILHPPDREFLPSTIIWVKDDGTKVVRKRGESHVFRHEESAPNASAKLLEKIFSFCFREEEAIP
jgi:hypothetical protein